MPPQVEDVSEDESTGTSIPFDSPAEGRGDTGAVAAAVAETEPPEIVKETDNKEEEDDGDREGANNDDDEEEEEDEEVYIVEKIVGHEFAKNGNLFLQVKWKGYDKPEDSTMEPEENLIDGAKEAVEEYYQDIGGRPEKPTKKRKPAGGAKRAAEDSDRKRRKAAKKAVEAVTPEDEESIGSWIPKSKNWENEVASVDTVSREKSGDLYAFLAWTNGKKSKVSTEICYRKCPIKLLKFYEDHLVFKDPNDD